MGHDNVKDLLQATGTILGAVPAFGGIASAIVDVTIQIMEIAEAPGNNKEDCINLMDTATAITTAMAVQVRASSHPQGLEDKLNDLRLALIDVNKCVADVAPKSFRRRLLSRAEDKQKIEKARAGLERASKLFMFDAAMSQDNATTLLTDLITQARADDALKALKESLKPLGSAMFDSHDAPQGCFPDTRVDILKEIETWAADPASPNVFWLAGLAGTGKSAVAYSVSKHLNNKQTLGGSFFFKAGVALRSDTSRVIPTLATQLAICLPELCALMNKAVSADPLLEQRTLEIQIGALIDTPLHTIKSREGPPIVIVLDALDECDKNGHDLLISLASKLPDCGPVKLFITSRPEAQVQEQLASHQPLGHACRSYFLHEVSPKVVVSDIRTYLRHRLHEIAKNDNELRDQLWPRERDLEMLVDRAGGFFLYAFIVAEFIAVPGFSPSQRLAQFLRDDVANSTPLGELDRTYLRILKTSLPSSDSDFITAEDVRQHIKRFRMIVEAIIYLKQSLSVRALSLLLEIPEVDIYRALQPLHRVVMTVPDAGTATTVTFFHKSFPEYLQSSTRCKDPRFHITKWSDRNDVQDWLDGLDQTSGKLTLGTTDHTQMFRQIRRLSHESARFPTIYYLRDQIPLAEGGTPVSQSFWSTVYAGVWRNRQVAMKVLRKESHQRKDFIEEVLIWRLLRHRNIVPFLGVSDMFPFCLVSVWMPKGSIRSYLRSHPTHRRTLWLLDICEGLKHIHTAGIVHGDLNGRIVLIDGEMRACLHGFNLSQQTYRTGTSDGIAGATLRWTPPEYLDLVQSEEKSSGTFAGDVYSLAMTWWEVYALREPFFWHHSFLAVRNAIGEGERPRRPVTTDPDGLIDGVWDLMQKCWAQDPLVRPDISTVTDRLRSVLQKAGLDIFDRL